MNIPLHFEDCFCQIKSPTCIQTSLSKIFELFIEVKMIVDEENEFSFDEMQSMSISQDLHQ